jgi:hypothetical protein
MQTFQYSRIPLKVSPKIQVKLLLPVMPSVAVFSRNGRMTSFTQTHEVAFIVRAAVRQRFDVVHFLRGGYLSVLRAPFA